MFGIHRLKLLVACIGLGFAVTLSASAAITNPMIRVCLSLNGEFFVANAGAADGNDLPMCQIGGGTIGAQALVDEVDGQKDLAVSSFLASGTSDPMQVCNRYGADDLQGTSDSSSLFHICEFSDGSLIDADTLARGANAVENEDLKNVLR